MTLFFDTKVQFLDSEAVSTISCWHKNEPIFAVASYSQNRGGSVTIFDDQGEPLRDITYPVHASSQATALCWHPEKTLLVTGWENGEIYSWGKGSREFRSIRGLHKAPIVLLAFSEQGGRLVSADAMGVLTGWRCDNHNQFLTTFTHDLKDPVLHLTFRKTILTANSELTNLAKAAVAGDESALDTLTNWRPRTAARTSQYIGLKDNHCFYIGTQSGILYYVNQQGTCTEVMKSTSSPIIQVLWHPHRDSIVTLMDDMTVAHFYVESSGNLSELDRVKLSGRIPGHNGYISWTHGSSLAIIIGDLSVRVWDMETSENYLLPTELLEREEGAAVAAPKLENRVRGTQIGGVEIFTCLSYCGDNQTICAGTSHGNLYTWRKVIQSVVREEPRAGALAPDETEDEDGRDVVGDNGRNPHWQLNNISSVRGAIKQCSWGTGEIGSPCILLNCISNVFIMREQALIVFYTRDVAALQKSSQKIWLERGGAERELQRAEEQLRSQVVLQSEIPVTNLSANDRHLVITNGRKMIVYGIVKEERDSKSGLEEPELKLKSVNQFSVENLRIFLHDEKIIVMDGTGVKILSLGGVTLQEFHFNDSEGRPIGIDMNGNFLVIFTMNGFIRMYDVSRHEPKLMTTPSGNMKAGYDLFDDFGEFIVVKPSAMGTHLAILIATANLFPDGKVYIWNLEKDALEFFDFFAVTSKLDNFFTRLPINVFWDTDDNRLLCCSLKCIQQRGAKKAALTSSQPGKIITESHVCIMFVSDKATLNELEVIRLASGEQLVNLCTPHVITLNINQIGRIALRDFKGLATKCDPETRRTVLDFSLNVAQGNMDQAFRCIRSIQSEAVWTNLAKMCVQTGRLDVAKVCLGHLKRAQSVRALRNAMQDETLETDAQIAVLAIELGMIDEAEALYKKCGRFDLLNRMYQAAGKFDEALRIAEQFDRMHLKNTYFKYGEWLRDMGDIQGAIKYFTKSQNATQNITQMLMDNPKVLKEVMQTTTDKKMLNWWGQYIESTGDMESSFKVYQKAEDYLSQVRILCFLGQIPKADGIATQSGDRAACYHLARHYENTDRVTEAIQFYTKARTYGNAVRICKENNLADELWTVANLAGGRDKVSAAAFYEESGDYKRAVELYHRAGMLHKAVEMAFASKQPEILQVIASELDTSSDPELVNRCAEFFLSIEQSHKAVQLLTNTRQFERALAVCAERGVPVTETFAEALTPNKDELDEDTRRRILMQLGDILQEQGDYHTATKKFTQAGDKIRAMKSLLKSGDTEKIVFFATMSRQKEVYVMAGNYLQALDWQHDSKILKNIITFYSKGQAFDLLANFYVTCSQVEVDEYRDYEKALKALQEANRCVGKIANSQKTADQLQFMIQDVKKVLQFQENLERGENQAVITGCRAILGTKIERPPVRHCDVMVLQFEAFMASKQFEEALNVLRDLTRISPDWSARGLIERELIEKLASETGLSFGSIWEAGDGRHKRADNEDDPPDEDEIEEEVE